MRHLSMRFLLIPSVLALTAFAQGAVSFALAACGMPVAACGDTSGPNRKDVPCRCGDLVTTNTRLNGSDPVMRGELGVGTCPGDGLFVAPNVTLTINGAILGRGSCSGIVLMPPQPGVTIDNVVVQGGMIHGFGVGVEAPLGAAGTENDERVTNSRFLRLLIFFSGEGGGIALKGDENVVDGSHIIHSRGHGILLKGDDNTVSGNLVSAHNLNGILIDGGQENHILRNFVYLTGLDSSSPEGVFIFGSRNIVDGNRVAHSGGDGFFIESGSLNTVSGNQAFLNGRRGFQVQGSNNSVEKNRSDYNADLGMTDFGGSPPNTTLVQIS